jgi:hypothetical protein
MRAEQFTGMAEEQTGEFLLEAEAVLRANRELLGANVQIKV